MHFNTILVSFGITALYEYMDFFLNFNNINIWNSINIAKKISNMKKEELRR